MTTSTPDNEIDTYFVEQLTRLVEHLDAQTKRIETLTTRQAAQTQLIEGLQQQLNEQAQLLAAVPLP